MKDINQIKLIADTLKKQKEKQLYELSKINNMLTNKYQLINKMIVYQKEYFSDNNIALSKTIPGLVKNLHLFTQRIEHVIQQAYHEIELLKKSREPYANLVEVLDKKISLMKVFSDAITRESRNKAQKKEENDIDDIAATSGERLNHE
jgi:flagellar biosynthesis chaperone FliJ